MVSGENFGKNFCLQMHLPDDILILAALGYYAQMQYFRE